MYKYQCPKNFAKHNALCKRDENYGILMGKPNNAICLDYDTYDPNCKEKQKYTLEYFKKVCGDDVYISRTPSGGYHAVFQYESRFDTWKNATKINGFIDIRTTGGYICGNGCATEKGSYCRLNGTVGISFYGQPQISRLLPPSGLCKQKGRAVHDPLV